MEPAVAEPQMAVPDSVEEPTEAETTATPVEETVRPRIPGTRAGSASHPRRTASGGGRDTPEEGSGQTLLPPMCRVSAAHSAPPRGRRALCAWHHPLRRRRRRLRAARRAARGGADTPCTMILTLRHRNTFAGRRAGGRRGAGRGHARARGAGGGCGCAAMRGGETWWRSRRAGPKKK